MSRDCDPERGYSRSSEDDDRRRERPWDSDWERQRREQYQEWRERHHDKPGGYEEGSAGRTASTYGRDWYDRDDARDSIGRREQREYGEPGRGSSERRSYEGRRPRSDDWGPEEEWTRAQAMGGRNTSPYGDYEREGRNRPGAGSAGNWGSYPTRSGSFGELGGQGFLGGGPSGGQLAGGYGRGEWAGTGGRSREEEMQRRGGRSYAGRGPKGYRRSDERIEEEINERLERHPEIDATEIQITVKEGEVTISGSVEDRRSKRLAEDLVENVYGVKDVQNHLRTIPQQSSSSSSQSSGSSGPSAGGLSSFQGSTSEPSRSGTLKSKGTSSY